MHNCIFYIDDRHNWWRHQPVNMAVHFLRHFHRSSISNVNFFMLIKRWSTILLWKLSENYGVFGKWIIIYVNFGVHGPLSMNSLDCCYWFYCILGLKTQLVAARQRIRFHIISASASHGLKTSIFNFTVGHLHQGLSWLDTYDCDRTHLTGVDASVSLLWTLCDDVLMTAFVYNTSAHYRTQAWQQS